MQYKEESINFNEIKEETMNELDNKVTLNKKHIVLHQIESNDVASIQKLAMKYSLENDTENTYLFMCKLASLGEFAVPIEYAISLYRKRVFKVSMNYFDLLSKYNHPITKFFIGIMKHKGEGCEIDRMESYSILKHLSDHGIDRATKFIKDHGIDNF